MDWKQLIATDLNAMLVNGTTEVTTNSVRIVIKDDDEMIEIPFDEKPTGSWEDEYF